MVTLIKSLNKNPEPLTVLRPARLNPVAVGSEQWPDVVKYFEGSSHAAVDDVLLRCKPKDLLRDLGF